MTTPVTEKELEALDRILRCLMEKHHCGYDDAARILIEELKKTCLWKEDE